VQAPAGSRLAPDLALGPAGRSPRGLAGPASLALLVVALAAAGLSALGLATGWWRVLPVLSPSMRPAFDAGSAVVAVRIPAASVRPGDVIVYQAPVEDRRVVAHRVLRVVEAGARPVVQTGGDANNAPDPWLARLEDDTVWTVRRELPHLGHALVLLHRAEVRAAMALVVVGCALAAGLDVIWRPRRQRG
jgi:signal peptidase I